METKTVKALRKIAKEKRLRGYSRLRKVELIDVINDDINDAINRRNNLLVPDIPVPVLQSTTNKRRVNKNKNLLDSLVPDIQTPVLQPNSYRSIPGKILDKVKTGVASSFKSFADWLLSYVPEPITRPVNEKLQALKSTVLSIFNKINKHKFEIRENKWALNGFTKQFTIDRRQCIYAIAFLNTVRPQVVGLLERNRQTKINLILWCAMERVEMKTGKVTSTVTPFRSKTKINLDSTNIREMYDNALDKIMESMAAFLMHGSNWRFKAVEKLDINTVAYRPLKGSTYIPLPEELANKKVIINMKNEDNYCLKWCIARALNAAKNNSERITEELR